MGIKESTFHDEHQVLYTEVLNHYSVHLKLITPYVNQLKINI